MAENTATINPELYKKTADEKMNARLKMWLEMCAHCGLCADACHFYLANDRDPKMMPAYKAKKVLEAIKKKNGVDEQTVGGHAVLAVGYDDRAQRFTVRNSWGPTWGQKGYFTMPYAYLMSASLASDFWMLTTVE